MGFLSGYYSLCYLKSMDEISGACSTSPSKYCKQILKSLLKMFHLSHCTALSRLNIHLIITVTTLINWMGVLFIVGTSLGPVRQISSCHFLKRGFLQWELYWKLTAVLSKYIAKNTQRDGTSSLKKLKDWRTGTGKFLFPHPQSVQNLSAVCLES